MPVLPEHMLNTSLMPRLRRETSQAGRDVVLLNATKTVGMSPSLASTCAALVGQDAHHLNPWPLVVKPILAAAATSAA